MNLTQFDVKLHIPQSDNGWKDPSSGLSSYLNEYGLVHQTIVFEHLNRIGVAERKNHHLLEITNALMFTMHVLRPFGLKPFSLLPMWWIRCHLMSLVLNLIFSLHLQSCFIFPIRFFTVFVSSLCLNLHTTSHPKPLKCAFFGYTASHKGFKCYHSPTHKCFVSMDVTFLSLLRIFFHWNLPLESYSEEMSSQSLLVLVPSYFFDDGIGWEIEVSKGKGVEPYEKLYVRTEKVHEVKDFPHVPHHESSSNPPNPSDIPIFDDCNVSIALTNGRRTCTQHLLSNFISYNAWSPLFHTFVF